MTSEEDTKKRPFTSVESTDHWSSEDINRIVLEIQASAATKKDREHINRSSYSDFALRYPFIYSMACDDHFDENTFKYMINMRNQVFNKERTIENASGIVGQKFFNTFVQPVVNNLDTARLEKQQNTL
jgi:hypothetical protein